MPFSGEGGVLVNIYPDEHNRIGDLAGYLVRDWTQSPAMGSPGGRKQCDKGLVLLMDLLKEARPLVLAYFTQSVCLHSASSILIIGIFIAVEPGNIGTTDLQIIFRPRVPLSSGSLY